MTNDSTPAPPPEPTGPSRMARFLKTLRNYLLQHLGLPSCFGETQYWVKSVRRVEP